MTPVFPSSCIQMTELPRMPFIIEFPPFSAGAPGYPGGALFNQATAGRRTCTTAAGGPIPRPGDFDPIIETKCLKSQNPTTFFHDSPTNIGRTTLMRWDGRKAVGNGPPDAATSAARMLAHFVQMFVTCMSLTDPHVVRTPYPPLFPVELPLPIFTLPLYHPPVPQSPTSSNYLACRWGQPPIYHSACRIPEVTITLIVFAAPSFPDATKRASLGWCQLAGRGRRLNPNHWRSGRSAMKVRQSNSKAANETG